MNCVVFLLSENLHQKLIKFYEPFKCDKFPPYSKFQAKNYDVIRSFTFNYKKMEEIVNKENEFEIRRNKTNKNKKMEIFNNEEFNNKNDEFNINNNNINVENLFNKNNIYSQEFKNIRNSLIN